MVEWLFATSRKTARRGAFDVDQVCRWSFFFIDNDRARLIRAGQHLARSGYEFIGVLEPDEDDDDQERIWLRVDRVERHTVASLMSRNSELDAFADAFGLACYDGMEVGAIDSP